MVAPINSVPKFLVANGTIMRLAMLVPQVVCNVVDFGKLFGK
jgi:hypothetical protein